MNAIRLRMLLAAAFFSMLTCSQAIAGQIVLQNATATASQTSFNPSGTIDGILTSNNGWAVFPAVSAQTIVWETFANQGSGSDLITFTMVQNHISFHTLLRFRLSYTTDDRSLFANALANGGDVSANWTVINLSSFSATNGATLTELADFSILASGTNPQTSIYTGSFQTTETGITGFRLEALEDPLGSGAGPGRQSSGNFVLTEMVIDVTPVNAVPEPASISLACTGLLGLLTFARLRRQRNHAAA